MSEVWNFIKGADGAYGYSGLDAHPTRGSFSRTPNDLDEVLEAVCADMAAIYARTVHQPALRKVLEATRCFADFKKLVVNPEDQGGRAFDESKDIIPSKYARHFQKLLTWGLIKECGKEELLFFSRYFSVAKTRDVDRAIFNGKRLSATCALPPKVNLPTYKEIFRRIEDLANGNNGKVWAVTGDLRNCFHTYSYDFADASGQTARFFGMCWKVGDSLKFAKWMGLPMGHSWSPAIAQACGWAMLTATNAGDSRFFRDCHFSDALPSLVPMYRSGDVSGAIIGWITIYYDNYLCVTNDHNAAGEMSRRWEKDMPRDFKVVIKPNTHKLFTWHDMQSSDKCLEYLGVSIGIAPRRRTTGEASVRGWKVRWRLAPNKIQQYKTAGMNAGERTATARYASGITGRLLHHALLDARPLGRRPDAVQLIEISRYLAQRAKVKDWDITANLSSDQVSHLEKSWSSMLDNAWMSFPTTVTDTPDSHCMHVISDASGTDGWGYRIYDQIGGGVVDAKEAWAATFPEARDDAHTSEENSERRNWHIYYKELYAACRGLKAAKERQPTCQRFVLGCDNAAVIGSIRRGYSHLAHAAALLSDLWHALGEADIRVVYVPTAENVADILSHLRAVDTSRAEDAFRSSCSVARLKAYLLGANGSRRAYSKGQAEPDEALGSDHDVVCECTLFESEFEELESIPVCHDDGQRSDAVGHKRCRPEPVNAGTDVRVTAEQSRGLFARRGYERLAFTTTTRAAVGKNVMIRFP